ncbi:MAG: hypothetical protein IKD58_03735, partial [Loktanella sp.]|nr:hypothetical protein [Loktanella sp.]
AAKVIMMRPHRWSDFSFGPSLTEAVARMPRNKAAIALANKLARIAWSLPRHGTRFDAFHGHQEVRDREDSMERRKYTPRV